MTNTEIARVLQQRARSLRGRNDNLYRVKAYRQAADALLRLDEPVEQMVQDEGPKALQRIPGIGPSLSTAITRYLETGEWDASN